MATYLSDVITSNDLMLARPGNFNVIRANPGSGKTTFAFDEKVLNLARAKKHMLYLIHNKLTRDAIVANHADKAVVFEECDVNGWMAHRRNLGGWIGELDEDKIHVMCYQTFAALLRNYDHDWLDDIDVIIWDEFDDIRAFYNGEIKRLRKLLPGLSAEQSAALLGEYNKTSMAAFIQQMKDAVLVPKKIILIALSATPEIAANIFQDTLNYLTFGVVELAYDALNIIYFQSIQVALTDGTLTPAPGKIFWCFTPYIKNEVVIEKLARQAGFKTLMIWSDNNAKNPLTDEQKIAIKFIKENNMIPEGYDFIIANGTIGRGIDLFDRRVQDWVYCGETYEDQRQFIRARFPPNNCYLPERLRGMDTFVREGIPVTYYEWHTIAELQDLIKTMPLYMDVEAAGINWEDKPFTTWSAAKKYYDGLGRLESRRYGKSRVTQYRFLPAPNK